MSRERKVVTGEGRSHPRGLCRVRRTKKMTQEAHLFFSFGFPSVFSPFFLVRACVCVYVVPLAIVYLHRVRLAARKHVFKVTPLCTDVR